jgi:hypothetical protein
MDQEFVTEDARSRLVLEVARYAVWRLVSMFLPRLLPLKKKQASPRSELRPAAKAQGSGARRSRCRGDNK